LGDTRKVDQFDVFRKEAESKTRYAGFWESQDKKVKERGVARQWIESTGQDWIGLRPCETDPPDCLA
jgi:hypothetical protein